MSYRFNLQPWREQERQQKQKNFIAITVGVMLLTLGLLGMNYYIENNYIKDQEATKRFLQSEVRELEFAKDKVQQTKDLIAEIDKQIRAIDQLQANRSTALELLDYISVNLPESVFLNRINFTGKELSIDGIAENDRGVADFMRMLQGMGLLEGTVLKEIKTAPSSGRYQVSPDSETKAFTVNASLLSAGGQ